MYGDAPLGSIWRPICVSYKYRFRKIQITEIIEFQNEISIISIIGDHNYWNNWNNWNRYLFLDKEKPHHFNNWNDWNNWNGPDFNYFNYLGAQLFEIETGTISIVSSIEIPGFGGLGTTEDRISFFQLFGDHIYWNNWNRFLFLD